MLRRDPQIVIPGRFALVIAVAAAMLSASAAVPHYFTRTWQVEQGLPQNKVTAVVQTRDGYLWVGTYCGLARFDGVRFTVFDDINTPELRSSRITSLFEAADGALWIGTESGEVSRYKDGHFAAVPLRPNWGGGKIYGITADTANDVWLVNEAGELARARDGKVLSPPAGGVSKFLCLARGTDGTIWVERDGWVSVLKADRLTSELSTNDYVQGFCAARDGGFWVAVNGRIRKWKDGKWDADFGAAPWGWNVVSRMVETSSGFLAGGASNYGLWLIHPGGTNAPAVHLDRMSGLPSDWVMSMWEDREKNLWCGTGAGLVVIHPSNLETISPPDKWQGCPVLSVLSEPDGTLWFGTEGAGLYRLRNGSWTNFAEAQGVSNYYIWSIAADNAGRIWAGSWGGGLYVQKREGFDFAPGLEKFRPPIPALLFSREALWIGTTLGAARYENGKLERFNKIADEPFGDVRAIAADPSGSLWFGTAGGGVIRLREGNFQRFRKSDGLSSDFIECLHFADDGALWIGTFGGGLNRLKKGKVSVINQEQGLPNGVIGHIEADDSGFFWMSSYAGILRASEADLNRCADGVTSAVPFQAYGVADGLPSLECADGTQSAGAKTADGRLWFPTAHGVVALDPKDVSTNPLAPPVQIESMSVDDKVLADARTAQPLRIPPGRHRIEFQYTALSFVAPEKVRFKCRLENFEGDWADMGEKRALTYNYIPPGTYAFRVTACNNDGVWNTSGASLRFQVLPYFWQTAWFRILGGVAMLLLAGGAVWFETRRRLRRKLERAERQRDIERERSRIARDIHDDLGVQLTRITMMSESARGKPASAEPAAADLKIINDTARELTRRMDEIVWAVNPRHDTLEGLATYLEEFAQDWLAAAGIRCRLDFPLQFPDWHLTSEVRHNVFLAAKEALHNTVKHSGASEILVLLVVKKRSFELAIEDNGRGFALDPQSRGASASAGRTAGNGIENMRRRLAAIGGICEIQSLPAGGTKVRFTVELKGLEASSMDI